MQIGWIGVSEKLNNKFFSSSR